MNWSKFFFWSTVLSLPMIFLPRKKPAGTVDPGPETRTDDGETVVTEPSKPPEPLP